MMQGPQVSPEIPERTLARDRMRDFILLQVIFWTAYLVIRTVAALQGRPEYAWSYMPSRIALVLAGAGATTLIHMALSRFEHWSTLQRLWLALGLCTFMLFPMNSLERSFALLAGAAPAQITFIGYVLNFGWVLFMWAGYYFAQDHAHRARRQGVELVRAQAAAHQAQIKMLRYQLNPHFLFNTLNAISTLVLEHRNADAERMILRLSRFMRHTIDTDPEQFARLDEEARTQLLYLEIEAARFGDRLRVDCDIPPDLGDCLVPSLLLQPIVENCIKHAISPSTSGGTVRISARAAADRLKLSVEDDGPGLGAGAPHPASIGVRNTRERLRSIYGDDASVRFHPRDTGGLCVAFDLPIHRTNAA
ncbi:MAG: histidine kinase [Hyphomonadaceae bacterium]|nr:histidine kinase [Hyphomonadaceae bacterium]